MKKSKILDLTRNYIDEQGGYDVFHSGAFVPGHTYIRTSGSMWSADDVVALVDVALDRWYTDGKYAHEFERLLATVIKQRFVTLCNSGSSANLLALTALMSKEFGEDALKAGDEVIVVAAGFPTTVNPVVQNGLVPVFVDISLPTYNALPFAIEEAVTPKTKAIFIAHTMGNPYRAQDVRDLADRSGLWVIADCCDALGAEHKGQPLPFWADLSTFSFYPAHHISMAEGGAVATNNPRINKVVRSLRDWGRDCWCETGKDNTCGKRFSWRLGKLPEGFDHKYVYSHIGYNLKATDLQAALGVSQIKKLPGFIDARRRTWEFYREQLDELDEFFVMPEPTAFSNPSWFGFLLTVKDSAPFTRNELVQYLEENKIGTRMLFAGNLTKHPAYQDVKYRISGVLKKTDIVMNQTFWMGVSPVVTPAMREYVAEKMFEFVRKK